MDHAATIGLRKELFDLFLAGSEAVVQQLRQLGIPLTGKVVKTVIVRAPGSWQTADDGYVWRNILDIGIVSFREPLFREPELAITRHCAAQLAESAHMTLPFWAPFGPPAQALTGPNSYSDYRNPDPESDLAGWVEAYIILPALAHHLAMMPSADRATEKHAAAFADEVLNVIYDDKLHYRTVIPLSGIDLEAVSSRRFSRQEISIRQLNPAEQDSWFKDLHGGFRSPHSPILTEPPQVTLELASSGPRASQLEPSAKLSQRLITALQLNGHRVAGRFAHHESTPSWVSSTSLRIPLTLPSRAVESSVLRRQGFSEVLATAKQLANYDVDQPKSPRDLALHRFIAGVARENQADSVLDFTIALEALLLPYDEDTRRGDLSYRFRMHGAHYLSEDVGQRTAVVKRLKEIYDLRSRLVHGRDYPDPERIRIGGEDARELARFGLLRAVQEGFPTAEKFNRMILGQAQ